MARNWKPRINLDSLRRSCCSAHWKESRRRSEVPIRQRSSDRHAHNHRHSRASERYRTLEGSYLDPQSRLEVDSSFGHQGSVLPWEIDGLVGMLTSNWPNWTNEGHLVGSWLQAHRRIEEIHIQAMPAESLAFVAAEESIRRTGRLEDDLYPTSHYCISESPFNLSVNRHHSLTLHFKGRPLTL